MPLTPHPFLQQAPYFANQQCSRRFVDLYGEGACPAGEIF
jgi:hypothetical protein